MEEAEARFGNPETERQFRLSERRSRIPTVRIYGLVTLLPMLGYAPMNRYFSAPATAPASAPRWWRASSSWGSTSPSRSGIAMSTGRRSTLPACSRSALLILGSKVILWQEAGRVGGERYECRDQQRHGVRHRRHREGKTIGEAYLAISGGNMSAANGADAALVFACAPIEGMASLREATGLPVERVGIHSGPVVGVIVAATRMAYDYWGETMNVASRIEGHAAPDGIAVSESTYLRCREKGLFEALGRVPLKGVGDATIYRTRRRWPPKSFPSLQEKREMGEPIRTTAAGYDRSVVRPNVRARNDGYRAAGRWASRTTRPASVAARHPSGRKAHPQGRRTFERIDAGLHACVLETGGSKLGIEPRHLAGA